MYATRLDIEQGEALELLAEHLYGVKRDPPSMTDCELRDACKARLIDCGIGLSNDAYLAAGVRPVRIDPPPPIKYGATCKRCNEFNEYVEASDSFVCYGCRR